MAARVAPFRAVACLAAVLAVAQWFAIAAAAADQNQPVLLIETARHTSQMNDAASDTAGQVLLSVGDDKTARLWSLPTLRPLGVLRPSVGPRAEGALYAVAVSPDGSLAAVGGFRAEVLLFDLHTRNIVHRWAKLPDSVLSLAFSADGSRLAVGLGAQGIRILQLADGTTASVDTDYAGPVYGLDFARDGRLAAVALDGGLRLYDSLGALRARVQTQAGHRPTHVRFSPDGRLLAVGFNDALAVDVRNSETLEPKIHPNVAGLTGRSLERVAWSRDGQTLYAGGATVVHGLAPIFAWAAAGAGARRMVDVGFAGQVATIQPLADGALAIGSLDGDLAVAADFRRVSTVSAVSADLEVGGSASDPSRGYRISQDGTVIEWVPLAAGIHYAAFDAGNLVLDDQATPRPRLASWSANAGTVVATNWDGDREPKVNGNPLSMERNERAESVDVRASGVLLGTQWRLRLYDGTGQPQWSTRLPAPAWRVAQSPDGRLAVAALGDGTQRWYRMADGHELLAVFITRDGGRWIAFTPSGYYAASPGGENLIGWNVNRAPDQVADFFDASRFRDRFYRPDVVRLVLKTLDETKALQQADAARQTVDAAAAPITDDLPPVVTILSPADGTLISGSTVTVQYAVRSPSGRPLSAVHASINGVAVPDAAADTRSPLPQPATPDAEARSTLTLTLPSSGAATIALVAQTSSRASEAAKVLLRLPVVGAAPHNAPAPRLNAVLIGVSAYDDQTLRAGVEYAANDAAALEQVLREQGDRGLYREVNIRLVVNGDATREGVVDALDWLRQHTTSSDVSVVFMAGHGLPDNDGRVFFLPVGIDMRRLTATGVSQSDLLSLFGKVPGRKVAFLDFCHSGGAVFSQSLRGAENVDMVGFLNQLHEPGSGLIVFAAATAREPAIQLNEQQHGAFTIALLRALGGQADYLHSGWIDTAELNLYLGQAVRSLTEDKQHPIMERADDLPDFPLVAVAKVAH